MLPSTITPTKCENQISPAQVILKITIQLFTRTERQVNISTGHVKLQVSYQY